MLSALADYAAIAIENAANFNELAQLKEREVGRIRAALKRFVPPNLLDKMLASGPAEAQSNHSEISVALVMLRGYEAQVARANPQQLANALNQYLDLAVEVMSHYGGTVEKYLGDGLVAYFNAPDPLEDHVMKAIEAAVALQHSASQRSEGFTFSVALHIGQAVVGNIGAVRGLGFSAVGDTIRLVQRLLEKAQSGQILVSEDLISHVARQDQVQATYLGQLTIQERQQRLNVYEVVGLA
jgi:adenylate cyclase